METMDVLEIMDYLPHRYPFLLVDRITKIEDKYIEGIKNVTINEYFFQGHFPGHPIMPGVLIVEGIAQAGGVLVFSQIPDRHEKVVYFSNIDKVKFRNPVLPGDQITYKVNILRFAGKVCKLRGEAWVGDKLCVEGEMVAILVDKEGEN